MSSYGSISYTDVVNQVREHGWTIETQSPDSTVITKRRGAPGIIVIPLAIIPVIGAVVGIAWIAMRGTTTVTIERKRIQARVLTPTNEFDVNSPEDLDMFFSLYNYKGSVGYYPVATVGGVVLILLFLLSQYLGLASA